MDHGVHVVWTVRDDVLVTTEGGIAIDAAVGDGIPIVIGVHHDIVEDAIGVGARVNSFLNIVLCEVIVLKNFQDLAGR